MVRLGWARAIIATNGTPTRVKKKKHALKNTSKEGAHFFSVPLKANDTLQSLRQTHVGPISEFDENDRLALRKLASQPRGDRLVLQKDADMCGLTEGTIWRVVQANRGSETARERE